MMKNNRDTVNRDTVLIVGSTGSLGRPIVEKLLQMHRYKVRLLARSRDSLERAGYINRCNGMPVSENLEYVVCNDVTDRSQFLDEWFADITSVICVARPRSLQHDAKDFVPMVNNLCEAVCSNGVPRLMLHGMPYVGESPFNVESPTMKIIQEAETKARECIYSSSSQTSLLSISRMCELSEIGHIQVNSCVQFDVLVI